MIILDIDIATSKTDTIISEIDNGHVYDLAHACFRLVQNFKIIYLANWKV
jgi:hypothetical protein